MGIKRKGKGWQKWPCVLSPMARTPGMPNAADNYLRKGTEDMRAKVDQSMTYTSTFGDHLLSPRCIVTAQWKTVRTKTENFVLDIKGTKMTVCQKQSGAQICAVQK